MLFDFEMCLWNAWIDTFLITKMIVADDGRVYNVCKFVKDSLRKATQKKKCIGGLSRMTFVNTFLRHPNLEFPSFISYTTFQLPS